MSGASNMSSISISDINSMSDAEWATAFDREVGRITMSQIDEELDRLTEEDRASRQQQHQQDSKSKGKATTAPLPRSSPPTPPQPELEECPICKEETESPEANFVSLPCAGAHQAHPECFKQWLESSRDKPTCPLCRQSMAHNCGHALSAGYLVAGTAVPPQILESPCKKNCEGAELMRQRRYVEHMLEFRRVWFGHVIYPLVRELTPSEEQHLLTEFQGQSDSFWIDYTVGRLQQRIREVCDLQKWFEESSALAERVCEPYQREIEGIRARRTAAEQAHPLVSSRIAKLEKLIRDVRDPLKYLERETERILDKMGTLVRLFYRWRRVADPEFGLGRSATSDGWWDREHRQMRTFLRGFIRLEKDRELLLTSWRDREGRNYYTWRQARVPLAPPEINHSWNNPVFGAPVANDPTRPAEDWTGAIQPAPAEQQDNIAEEEGNGRMGLELPHDAFPSDALLEATSQVPSVLTVDGRLRSLLLLLGLPLVLAAGVAMAVVQRFPQRRQRQQQGDERAASWVEEFRREMERDEPLFERSRL
ncbi:hypothetical protein PG995_014893 [Apiospora arundinis]|uniref:Zinc ion binding n=1 Tax=Apiospora arundinis TaxID=335852 RepID=A0ABR2II67_9PEZI